MSQRKIFAVNDQEQTSHPGGVSAEDRISRLETALLRSERRATAGRLAASVMHEINNPSQAIADLVYLLAREAENPDQVKARAAQIEEQLGRIQYTTRQTLSFFRESPQRLTKDFVPLVDAALRYHSEQLLKKNIRVIRQLPDTLVGPVYPGDFLQLMSNLIRNAAEALPAGGSLRIKLRALRASVYVTVADNGPGIAAPIKANLFEAFQSDKAENGNGLGLWICKRIAAKHGGRIYCRSKTDGMTHGTTFLVSLPFVTSPTQGRGVVPFLRQR
jgi:signal transduction histidine kinase